MGHTASVYKLIDLESDHFISFDGNGMMVKWSKTSESNDGYLIAKDNHAIYTAYLDRDANNLYIGNNFGQVSIIDLNSNLVIKVYNAHKAEIYDIVKVDNYILSCGKDGAVCYYNINENSIEKSIHLSSAALRCFLLYQDEILIGGSDGYIYTLYLWNNEIVRRKISEMSIFTLYLHNEKIYAGGRDAKLYQLRARDKKTINIIDAHMSTINCIAALNNLIITACRDKTIRIWTEEMQLVQTLSPIKGGHINSVNCILSMVETDCFYSTGDDNSIIRWEVI
jgi:WD40 repeat protein